MELLFRRLPRAANSILPQKATLLRWLEDVISARRHVGNMWRRLTTGGCSAPMANASNDFSRQGGVALIDMEHRVLSTFKGNLYFQYTFQDEGISISMPSSSPIYGNLPVDSETIRILTLLPSLDQSSEIHCRSVLPSFCGLVQTVPSPGLDPTSKHCHIPGEHKNPATSWSATAPRSKSTRTFLKR